MLQFVSSFTLASYIYMLHLAGQNALALAANHLLKLH
ncbi:hypothetical protein F383_17544 [Gossypium arboreum]|uniref:Uncharacterized protein n=1 Tax=Gossypium arboreum TaxID=29729 RepID=A0A0B0NGL7_GOSAR|nr:hypothetical protein F383_17544 [Gossypium arboreum]